jgi:hypothetical protein
MAINTKAPFTSLVVFTFTLNAIVAIDNSKFSGGNLFQSPLEAVEIATSADSREYFTPEQKISAPIMTTTAADVSSRGQVPPWDVTSGQLVLQNSRPAASLLQG